MMDTRKQARKNHNMGFLEIESPITPPTIGDIS
jgi:hypothetical protein